MKWLHDVSGHSLMWERYSVGPQTCLIAGPSLNVDPSFGNAQYISPGDCLWKNVQEQFPKVLVRHSDSTQPSSCWFHQIKECISKVNEASDLLGSNTWQCVLVCERVPLSNSLLLQSSLYSSRDSLNTSPNPAFCNSCYLFVNLKDFQLLIFISRPHLLTHGSLLAASCALPPPLLFRPILCFHRV